MKFQIALVVLALSGFTAVQARAALTPAHQAGSPGAVRDCVAPAVATAVSRVARYSETRLAPVSLDLRNGVLYVRIDERVMTFHAPEPAFVRALRDGGPRTGLAARLSPQAWFRCA